MRGEKNISQVMSEAAQSRKGAYTSKLDVGSKYRTAVSLCIACTAGKEEGAWLSMDAACVGTSDGAMSWALGSLGQTRGTWGASCGWMTSTGTPRRLSLPAASHPRTRVESPSQLPACTASVHAYSHVARPAPSSPAFLRPPLVCASCTAKGILCAGSGVLKLHSPSLRAQPPHGLRLSSTLYDTLGLPALTPST